jgi:hypothetical protein
MPFTIEEALEILERTPSVLESMLTGLSGTWTDATEGPETWSAFDIVGHLIHGERTDWVPRMEIVLSGKPDRMFTPFDMTAHFHDSKGKTLAMLLQEFRALRTANIVAVRAKGLTGGQLETTGTHPELGKVTLEQLLATWVVHDLDHLSQITRVMAVQYRTAVGPWRAYLKILA